MAERVSKLPLAAQLWTLAARVSPPSWGMPPRGAYSSTLLGNQRRVGSKFTEANGLSPKWPRTHHVIMHGMMHGHTHTTDPPTQPSHATCVIAHLQ
eukprot:16452315-Heterocapsa_arctica.AAC.1